MSPARGAVGRGAPLPSRRSRPARSRTPRPRRRGRRGARRALASVCVLRGIGDPPDSGRCRRETPPSAPDRSPLRIRPRRLPRHDRALPAPGRARRGPRKQRAAASGPRGWAPLPRSASRSSLAARPRRRRAGRGRRRRAAAALGELVVEGARARSGARARPRRDAGSRLPAAGSARRARSSVRPRAAGRRGRRARSRAASSGSRSSSAYSASAGAGPRAGRARAEAGIGDRGRAPRAPLEASSARAARGRAGNRADGPLAPARSCRRAARRLVGRRSDGSAARLPGRRRARPRSAPTTRPRPLRRPSPAPLVGRLVRVELAEDDARLDRAVPVVDLEPHRGVDRVVVARRPSCERPKATPSARWAPLWRLKRACLPSCPIGRTSRTLAAGTSSRTPGLPIPNGASRPSSSARSRPRSAPPTIASIRSVRLRSSGPSTAAAWAANASRKASRFSARSASPAAARCPPKLTQVLGAGLQRRRAGRSRGCCGPSRALRPRRRARSTIAGRWWRSTSREATIPITPGCQPSPATTSAGASRSRSGSSRRAVSAAVSTSRSVARRSLLARLSSARSPPPAPRRRSGTARPRRRPGTAAPRR